MVLNRNGRVTVRGRRGRCKRVSLVADVREERDPVARYQQVLVYGIAARNVGSAATSIPMQFR